MNDDTSDRPDFGRPLPIALLVLSHAAVAVVGAAAGFRFADWQSAAGVDAGQAALGEVYTAYVDMQRTVGAGREHEDAIMKYLVALEAARRSANSPLEERAYHMEKALACMRLAPQAERGGKRSAVAEFQNQSVAACTASRRDGCSAEDLRNAVLQVEQNCLTRPATVTPAARPTGR